MAIIHQLVCNKMHTLCMFNANGVWIVQKMWNQAGKWVSYYFIGMGCWAFYYYYYASKVIALALYSHGSFLIRLS